MAVNNFYIQTTGSNLNAGSTTSDSASVTSTNGDWGNAAANRFTAASGTPFSAVSVGEWAAVHLDAASATVYVAQVTAINAGGASIDLSTTAKYGTAPATSATGRTCKIGGAWATPAHALTFGSTTAAYNSTTIHIKSGTYANTTTTITANITGATTAPVVVNGYNTTPGDCDLGQQLTKPLISFTTGRFNATGSHVTYANISFTSANTSNATFGHAGASMTLHRCRADNTNAGASSSAVSVSAVANAHVTDCYLTATTTATRILQNQGFTNITDTYFDGGAIGVENTAGSSNVCNVHNCIFDAPTTYGIYFNSAGGGHVDRCSFYNVGADAIRFATVPTNGSRISNNVFVDSATYNVNNSSGTDTNLVVFRSNASYSPGTAHTAGFGDVVAWGLVTETAQPFINGGSNDFRLVTGALARGAVTSRRFENTTITSYRDRGAVQGDFASIFMPPQRRHGGGGTERVLSPPLVISGAGSTTQVVVPIRTETRWIEESPTYVARRYNYMVPGVVVNTQTVVPVSAPAKLYESVRVDFRRQTHVVAGADTVTQMLVPVSAPSRLYSHPIYRHLNTTHVVPGPDVVTQTLVPVSAPSRLYSHPIYRHLNTSHVIPGANVYVDRIVPLAPALRMFGLPSTHIRRPASIISLTQVTIRPVIVSHSTVVR